MPIQPRPCTYHCPSCGWSKTTAPLSDALMPGEYFDRCPKCGGEELTRRPASLVDLTLAVGLARAVKLFRG